MAKITNEFKTTLGDLPQTLIYIVNDVKVAELMLWECFGETNQTVVVFDELTAIPNSWADFYKNQSFKPKSIKESLRNWWVSLVSCWLKTANILEKHYAMKGSLLDHYQKTLEQLLEKLNVSNTSLSKEEVLERSLPGD